MRVRLAPRDGRQRALVCGAAVRVVGRGGGGELGGGLEQAEGEDAAEQGAEGGEAGADDGDLLHACQALAVWCGRPVGWETYVQLDGRPGRGAGRGHGLVVAVGDAGDGVEADGRHDAADEAEGEGDDHAPLAVVADVEPEEPRDGDDDYDDVDEHVHGGVEVVVDGSVHAVSW